MTPPTSLDLLTARAVTKSYDRGAVQALRGVDLCIAGGEIVAVTGPSGSGKSTLLHLLGGLDRPTSGDILYHGAPLVREADLDRFRATRVGLVFQSFHLLPTLTAAQNVQIPLFETEPSSARRRARAGDLLGLVGLTHRSGHLPEHMSVGERQRVAIARALANDPEIILADEPTGSLDSRAAAGVIDLLGTINRDRGTAVVVVTHSDDVAALAHRRFRMLDGRLSSSGAGTGVREDGVVE